MVTEEKRTGINKTDPVEANGGLDTIKGSRQYCFMNSNLPDSVLNNKNVKQYDFPVLVPTNQD